MESFQLIEKCGISKASITNWCNEFNEECEAQSKNDPDTKTEADYMKENRRLRQELEDAKKENLFLKKAAAFFAKEIGQRLTGLSMNMVVNSKSDGY